MPRTRAEALADFMRRFRAWSRQNAMPRAGVEALADFMYRFRTGSR